MRGGNVGGRGGYRSQRTHAASGGAGRTPVREDYGDAQLSADLAEAMRLSRDDVADEEERMLREALRASMA